MKPFHLSLVFALLGMLIIAAVPEKKTKGGGANVCGQVESAVVPPYLFNIWLCRPGADSVTASVLAWEAMEAFITYGDGLKTESVKLELGVPQSLVISGLMPEMSYSYQFTYRRAGGGATQDVACTFHTQRKAKSSFSFVMQADSELDMNTDVSVYQQTLANMLTDKPDFMIDLGDTTMVDKFWKFYTRSDRNTSANATTWAASHTACPFSWCWAITTANA